MSSEKKQSSSLVSKILLVISTLLLIATFIIINLNFFSRFIIVDGNLINGTIIGNNYLWSTSTSSGSLTGIQINIFGWISIALTLLSFISVIVTSVLYTKSQDNKLKGLLRISPLLILLSLVLISFFAILAVSVNKQWYQTSNANIYENLFFYKIDGVQQYSNIQSVTTTNLWVKLTTSGQIYTGITGLMFAVLLISTPIMMIKIFNSKKRS